MMPPGDHIPAKAAIIPYYITAAAGLVLVSVLCLNAANDFPGHYFQPKILAIIHLAVFGWASMVIFGASNQLIPVIAEARLFSEKVPVLVLGLMVAGLAMLIPSFWLFTFNTLSYTGAFLLLLAIILHAINLYRTGKRGKNNIIMDFVMTAHVWLILTAVIGCTLLLNLQFAFLSEDHLHYLKIHAMVGIGGWFLQLVTGISARLIPMFLLSRHENTKWLNVTYYCFNVALICFLLEGMIAKSTWGQPLYLTLFIAGLVFYADYIRRCYGSAMRKQMDHGMKQTFLALFLLSIPFVLLTTILTLNGNVSPNTISAFGFSFFGGFITVIIMGQTFKTLPFIVWMHKTRPDKLPDIMPKDLLNEHWVKWQMYLYLPGFLLFLSGFLLRQTILIYGGGSLMSVASAWYFTHVLIIVNKLRR